MDSIFIPLDIVTSSQIALNIISRNLHWLVLGVLTSMVIAAIPGMGGAVVLSIIIPFTFGMDSTTAFIILAGAMGATSFSGSISAILVNAPGTGGNAATLLDGYPLTQKGEAATALGASAMASAAGAIVGISFFLLMIPLVLQVVLLFGPSEIFWMVLIGISVVPLVTGNKRLAGLAMGGLGLIVSFIGRSVRTGETRFTFGQPYLFDGIGLIPVVVGLFAIAEMIKLSASSAEIVSDPSNLHSGNKINGVFKVIENKWLWLRSSLIGILVGAIPGVGATVANFIAYGHAVQISDDPDSFGSGRIEGVIAPESANDAKDGGQLFPTLGLGIPGSGSTAILLGAFIMHGITPGPTLLTEKLDLMLIIAYSLLFSNILTSIFGLLLIDQIVKILQIPIKILFPSIITLSLTAVFILRNSYMDLYIALTFGILGVILMYLNVSRIPIIIALVLGGIMEANYHVAIQLANNNIHNAFFVGWLNQILIITLILSIIISTRGLIIELFNPAKRQTK